MDWLQYGQTFNCGWEHIAAYCDHSSSCVGCQAGEYVAALGPAGHVVWFRPLGPTTLTTMWSLTSTVRRLQWLHGILGSSAAPLSPVTRNQGRLQWWPKLVDTTAGCQCSSQAPVEAEMGGSGERIRRLPSASKYLGSKSWWILQVVFCSWAGY